MNKPFTEIDRPLNLQERLILMPQWLPAKAGLGCMHCEVKKDGKIFFCDPDDYSDIDDIIYPCPVCNGYYCPKHTSNVGMHTDSHLYSSLQWLCLNCAKLSHDERERVIALRTAIERGEVAQ